LRTKTLARLRLKPTNACFVLFLVVVLPFDDEEEDEDDSKLDSN
jgi:hypothetical protein